MTSRHLACAWVALLAAGSARAESPAVPGAVTREQAAGVVLESGRVHPRSDRAAPSRAAPAGTLSHTVFGYYPEYMGDDFSGLRFDLLTHVGYFTGGCTADGGFSAGAWPFDGLVEAAHAAGTKVMLVIPCFSEERIHMILTEPVKRQAFIDGVVAAMSTGIPADGVDLDFETMAGHHLGDYPLFVADLVSAVREVLPDAEFSSALPAVDWSSAYDYPKLAAVLDHLIIMGYDYHWKGGNPGPVSPLDYTGGKWSGYSRDLQWSIDDYRAAIDDPALDGKIVLGLPYYGYDWPSADFDIPGVKTANATARLYEAAVEMAAGGYQYDPESQANYFFYEDETGPHQLWFDDAQTLGMKFSAAKDRGIGGVAIWALMYDGGRSELWETLEATFYTPGEEDPDEPGNPNASSGSKSGCSVAVDANVPVLPWAFLLVMAGIPFAIFRRR